jgi:hypothetical protein
MCYYSVIFYTVLETRLADEDLQFTNLVFLLRDRATRSRVEVNPSPPTVEPVNVTNEILCTLYMQLENFVMWKLQYTA